MFSDQQAIFFDGWFSSVGDVPSFAGITSLVNNNNGTLTIIFPQYTGIAATVYYISVHTEEMTVADLDNHTYIAGVVKEIGLISYTAVLGVTGQMHSILIPNTEYYVAVRALNANGEEIGTLNLSTTVTNAAIPDCCTTPQTDPLYYDQYYGMTKQKAPCEADAQDDIYGEYIGIYGGLIDIYLCSDYDPIPVFGEDPVKKYEIEPFQVKGMWDLTPEVLKMGRFGKNTEDEVIIAWIHKSTIKNSIENALGEAGLIPDEDTIPDDTGMTKYDRHRRELQEGDIFKLHFNNIHYEIDSVKQEPEYQHHFGKYVYEITARPRLLSAEEIGTMQPIVDAEEIRVQNSTELQIEANKILF